MLSNISKEGLMVGDLVYFCSASFKKPANGLIKIGNLIAFSSHVTHYRHPVRAYLNAIHVELVIKIDYNGHAVLASCPGPHQYAREITFAAYKHKVACNNLIYESYVVLRPKHQYFAKRAAWYMQEYVMMDKPYSLRGCATTLFPRWMKRRDTSNSSSMMCQESVFNAMLKAQRDFNIELLPHKLKAQATPGMGLYDLVKSGNWLVSPEYDIDKEQCMCKVEREQGYTYNRI